MLKRQIEKHIFSPYDASQKLLLCKIYFFFHHEKPLAWISSHRAGHNNVFDERLDVLEVEGTQPVGGDILLQGEFPKMDQTLATATNALNSSIALKANQSDMDELEVTLNTKANRSDLEIALSLTGEQTDALNVLLGTKANQSDVDAELALKANQPDVALTTEVPSTTDILNNTNVGATAVGGAYASVNVVNKTS